MVAKKNLSKSTLFGIIIDARKGYDVNTQRTVSPDFTNHDETIAMEGLDDLFKWASEMVADGQDSRVKIAQEQRIRRQVLEFVQRARQEQAVKEAASEVSYLQRRVIALLQSLQELSQENSSLKQVMVAQYFALERIPALESEITQLRRQEFEKQCGRAEQQELLTALSRLKQDRDFIEHLLTANEQENTRLSRLLSEAREQLKQIQSRRWWHRLLGIR